MTDMDLERERGRVLLVPRMEDAAERALSSLASSGAFSLKLEVHCQFQSLPLTVRIMHGKRVVWEIEGDLNTDCTKFVIGGRRAW